MKLGCHISISKGFPKAVENAHKLGCEAFQSFTKNPRGFKGKSADPEAAAQGRALMAEYGLVAVAHAPYITNLSTPDPELQAISIASLKQDLENAEAYGAIGEYLGRIGVAPSGPPYARYLSVKPEHAVFEAGMPVAKALPGEGEIVAAELPDGDVAVTTHFGPFDQMQPGYEAIEEWMRENGRADGGPPWEVYMTDPGEEPDPAKWRTDIYWPLA